MIQIKVSIAMNYFKFAHFALCILGFVLLGASVCFIIQNRKIKTTNHTITIKLKHYIKENHHFYTEKLVIDGDTNVTYVDSITFESK